MNKDIEYPYPVLSPFNNDYKIGKITYKCHYDNINQKLIIDCIVTNRAILKYIKKHDMAYSIRISCSNSRYRISKSQFIPHFEIKLSKDQVNNPATLDVFVVVVREITNFEKEPLADIYADNHVNYYIGNYAAIANHSTLDFEFNNRQSKPFIQYQKDKKVKDTKVYVDEDGITVFLSPNNFQKYSQYERTAYSRIVFYAITVPAVNNAIFQVISREPEDFNIDSCLWLQAMLRQSELTWEQIKDDASNVSVFVADVLQNPVNSLFENLDELRESEEII